MADAERNGQTKAWQAMLEVHSAVFGRLSRELSHEFGITLAKYDVLAQLHRFPNGINQRDLSRQLKVTDGNVTGLVRRLIADGLICREESASDRRAFLVQITEAGRSLYLAARARHDELLARLLGSIAAEQLSNTRITLEQLARTLDQKHRRETE